MTSTTMITSSDVEFSISRPLSSWRCPKCRMSLTPMKARMNERPAAR
jgi:hypothetical protein